MRNIEEFHVCPKCRSVSKEKISFFVCPECGEALCEEVKLENYTNNFCIYCGTSITEAKQEAMASVMENN